MRKRLNAINVTTLKAVDGKRTDYEDSLCPGLVLRITPRGTRTWVVRIRGRGKKERILLGFCESPNSPRPIRRRSGPVLGLSEARAKARDELDKADRGMGAAVYRGAGSVADLAKRCIDAKEQRGQRHKKPARPATLKEWRRLLDAEITKAPFAKLPACDLQRPQVRLWLHPIAVRAPGVANAALGLLKMTYAWAAEMEILPADQLKPLKKPGAINVPERYLDTREVRALWRALAVLEGPYSDATALLLLTGVRRRMVMEMTTGDLELEDEAAPRWVIGASRTKGHRDHVVPLSPQAVTIVRRRLEIAEANKLVHLFPIGNESEGEDLPMTWSSRWVAKLKKETQEHLGTKMEPWRVHELRHTVRTHLCEDLKVRDDVADLILMHKRPGVPGRYNRAELLDERRAALVSWAAWLDQGVSETKTADVIPFGARR